MNNEESLLEKIGIGLLLVILGLLIAILAAFFIPSAAMFQLNFEKMFSQMALFEMTPLHAQLLNSASNIFYGLILAFSCGAVLALAIPMLEWQPKIACPIMIFISAVGLLCIGYSGFHPENIVYIKRAVDPMPERDAMPWFYVVGTAVFAGWLVYHAYKSYEITDGTGWPSWLAMLASCLVLVIAVKFALLLSQVSMLLTQITSQLDIKSLVLSDMEISGGPEIVNTAIRVIGSWPTFGMYMFAFFVAWICILWTSERVRDKNCRRYTVITQTLWSFSMITSTGVYPSGDVVANYPALCWAVGIGTLWLFYWCYVIWKRPI